MSRSFKEQMMEIGSKIGFVIEDTTSPPAMTESGEARKTFMVGSDRKNGIYKVCPECKQQIRESRYGNHLKDIHGDQTKKEKKKKKKKKKLKLKLTRSKDKSRRSGIHSDLAPKKAAVRDVSNQDWIDRQTFSDGAKVPGSKIMKIDK